jgi:hypothetical protein
MFTTTPLLEPLVDAKLPGCRFTPRVIKNIREDLAVFRTPVNVTAESLYMAILEIFVSRSPEKLATAVNEAESWLALVPGNLRYICVRFENSRTLLAVQKDAKIRSSDRAELHQLDEDRRFLSGTIEAELDYFDSGQIRAFNREYSATFQRARRLADRNLQRMVSKKARSHTLCWSVIRKLRRDTGGLGIG